MAYVVGSYKWHGREDMRKAKEEAWQSDLAEHMDYVFAKDMEAIRDRAFSQWLDSNDPA